MVKKKPKIKDISWYGFSPELVQKKFEGNPQFIREFSIGGDTWAVFKVAEPNRTKNHKDFMLLKKNFGGGGIVAGLNRNEMRRFQYQQAIHCLKCNQIVYSVHRHDYHSCECENEVYIDGGKDYCKWSAKNPKKIRMIVINLITGNIVKHKPSLL